MPSHIASYHFGGRLSQSFKIGVRYMLPGLSFFILSMPRIMLSFYEYASEKRILELLIKERVKVAIKSKLKDVSVVDTLQKIESDQGLTIAEEIAMIMPPRDLWRRPFRRERQRCEGSKEKVRKQILTRSLALTIRHDRKHPDACPYLQRLDSYISSLRSLIMSTEPLVFKSIAIFGEKKKVDSDGVTILRPLCVFTSLTEKLLISLASKYLSDAFDPLLHEEILSYRPPRNYHDSEHPVITDRNNAIENLQEYRRNFSRSKKYVAECDIQKYFDTINHDVIRRCFQDFASRIRERVPDFDYSQVERVVEAYLNCYSFFNNVASKNEELKKLKKRFDIPKKEVFVERGCYTEDELAASMHKIGIPQGGALSGLMSNVVLSTIDRESLLSTADKARFFSRYGDDILLIHTSKDECQRLIDSYCKALTANKLLYHEFISVGDERFRRGNRKVRSCLWDQKSRSPFLWGRDNNDLESVDWIGFLGYEVRYTGEVRIRRSSLDKKFKNIKRTFRNAIKSKLAKGDVKSEELQVKLEDSIAKFAGKGLAEDKSLNANRYSMMQARRLNQYASRHVCRFLHKVARNNGCQRSVVGEWWKMAKEMDCVNYTKTLKNEPV